MSTKTPAEEQIEALRRMRQGQAKQEPEASSAVPPMTVVEPVEIPAELTEAVGEAKPPRHLEISEEHWAQLKERQARTREFKRKQEAGQWAAELLLGMPPGAHQMDAAGKAALFAMIEQWYLSRGRR